MVIFLSLVCSVFLRLHILQNYGALSLTSCDQVCPFCYHRCPINKGQCRGPLRNLSCALLSKKSFFEATIAKYSLMNITIPSPNTFSGNVHK